MKTDTSKTLRLEGKPLGWSNVAKLALLAAICLAIAAGNYIFGNSIAAYFSLLLTVLVLFLMTLTIVYIRNGIRATLELSPTGLNHSLLPDGEISWSVFRDAEIWRVGQYDAVLLKLSDEFMQKRQKTLSEKLTRQGNKLIGADGILIPHRPFDRGADELRDLIKTYAGDHSARKQA